VRTINDRNLIISGIWIITVLIVVTCSGQNDSQAEEKDMSIDIAQDPSAQPHISFDTLRHDFGTIIDGEMVVCYFEYNNSGKSDLVINSVEATCGCTIPDWSREPLKKGETESLKIIFDTTGRSGSQRKVVTVMSNASNSIVRLMITANVNNNV